PQATPRGPRSSPRPAHVRAGPAYDNDGSAGGAAAREGLSGGMADLLGGLAGVDERFEVVPADVALAVDGDGRQVPVGSEAPRPAPDGDAVHAQEGGDLGQGEVVGGVHG